MNIVLILRNKSSSTADAVQVAANLQEELSVHLHFRKLELERQVLEVISHIVLALTHFICCASSHNF